MNNYEKQFQNLVDEKFGYIMSDVKHYLESPEDREVQVELYNFIINTACKEKCNAEDTNALMNVGSLSLVVSLMQDYMSKIKSIMLQDFESNCSDEKIKSLAISLRDMEIEKKIGKERL